MMMSKVSVEDWISKVLSASSVELVPLAGDAGLRRYYRINQNSSSLLMDASKSSHVKEFMAIAELFSQNGIRAPEILHSDAELGYLHIEDFGNELLADMENSPEKWQLFKEAIDVIIKIQNIPVNIELPFEVPKFDSTFIREQLELFSQWFIKDYVEYDLSNDQKESLEKTFTTIEKIIEKQPFALMHTDYHINNLMVIDNKELGVIDFQDMMYGPVTYDLISLLKDRYETWSSEQNEELLQYYYDKHPQISTMLTFSELKYYFDITGLQRHLKILGVFARIYFQRNNSYYIQFFDKLLDYIVQVTAKYPEFDELYRLLTLFIIPKLLRA